MNWARVDCESAEELHCLPSDRSPSSETNASTFQDGVTFSYSKLPNGWFRFLKISSSKVPIELKLFNVKMQNGPGYNALSYTWGSDLGYNTVVCNGEPISVTVNLYAALYHFSTINDLEWFWIDAICINQKIARKRPSRYRT